MSARYARAVVVVMAAVLAGSSCSVEGVKVPSATGPSELALSLDLTASPDMISQDGVSTSRLNILARDANSLPKAGVSLRVDVMVPTANGLVVADYGTLSDRWPSTGSDGRASVLYQSPPTPAPTVTSDTTITLRVTPIGANYANTVPRVVDVKLVRPGTILPPTRMVPRFTFSPGSPREHDDIFFDASSSSDPDQQIVSYSWQWGDGSSGSGRQDSHSFDFAGSYAVVLTVSDSYGRSVSTSPQAITIGTSALPVARFTWSPTNPGVGATVVFNAAASTATSGRRIVAYNWDLGDGTFTEGQVASHKYLAPGAYTVTLVVTDDGGRKGVASQTLTVADLDAPVASFTVSPTDPRPGTSIVFNAAASTVPFGRTIVSYDWNFGDGSTGTGVSPSHAYAAEATYTVVLTVTDNTGRKGVKSVAVTVKIPFDAASVPDFVWESIR